MPVIKKCGSVSLATGSLRPVIGVLTTSLRSNERVQMRGVQGELACLSLLGRKLPGLTVVFSPADIDWNKRQINGCIFRPDDAGGGVWARIRTPLPDVVYDQIFNRAAEGRYAETRARLKQAACNRYFNPRYLNKLAVYNFLQPISEMQPYLPETRRLSGWEDLAAILANHGTAYIKPAGGSLGRGIIKVVDNGRGFSFQTRSGKKGSAAEIAELYKKISRLSTNRNLIVQQGLNLVRCQGRVVDVRILMQKNGRGSWSMTKIFARVGPPGNIISNLASGGAAHPLGAVLSHCWQPEQVQSIRAELRSLGFQACQHLETASGETFGELGVDLGVDTKGKVWLIELNSKPRRKIDIQSSNKLVQLAFTRPLRFALYLTKK